MDLINTSLLGMLASAAGVIAIMVFLFRFVSGLEYNTSSSKQSPAQPRMSAAEATDFNASIKSAKEAFQEYKYQDALNHYHQALQRKPNDPQVHYKIGQVHQALEDYTQAETFFTEALNLSPNFIEAMLSLATLQYKISKVETSLKLIDQLLTQRPDHRAARKFKARVLLDLNAYEESVRLLEELVSEDSLANMDLRLLLANGYEKMQKWDEAVKVYHNLMEQNTKDRPSLMMRVAQVHMYLMEFDEAIKILNNALSSEATGLIKSEARRLLAKAWGSRGGGLIKEGNFEEACSSYEKAVEYNPDDSDLFLGLAAAYEKNKLEEQAKRAYGKALAIRPNDSQVLMSLGGLYERTGEIDKAIESYMTVVEHVPSAHACYYLGTLYGVKGDMDNCVIYLSQAIKLDSNYVDAYYNLGVALEKQKRMKDAAKMYKKVLALDKDHSEAASNLKGLQTKKKA